MPREYIYLQHPSALSTTRSARGDGRGKGYTVLDGQVSESVRTICLAVSPPLWTSGFIHFTNGTTLYRIEVPHDGSADFELVNWWTWDSSTSTRFTMGSHRGIRWPPQSPYTEIGCLSCAPVRGISGETSIAVRELLGEDLGRVSEVGLECGAGLSMTCFDEQSGRLIVTIRDVYDPDPYQEYRCYVIDFA